ncbi:sensor histidine kinase [uncultured Sphingomonas sp.]|uniref:sensor histidine kinase n=1 Tax=uncultured Sphingomonas sp. TaxID=158754 RepID=UPI0035CB4B05
MASPDKSDTGGPGARAPIVAPYDVAGAVTRRDMADLADFAAELLDAPLATVTVMDDEYQHFLSAHGVDLPGSPRNLSFCTHFMDEPGVSVVPDAAADPRFADNLYVTGDFKLRFYAGAPLVTPDGETLGSVCVYDTVPREGLTEMQRHGLAILAKAAMGRLDDRRAEREREEARAAERARLAESAARMRVLADAMPQMVWSTRPDGHHDYYNARWYEFTGVASGSTDGHEWDGLFHPDDQARASVAWSRCLGTGEPYEVEYRLRRHDGVYRWVLGRALAVRDPDGAITRWVGTCTDMHEQRLASDEREVVAQELSHRIKNIFAVISGLITLAAKKRPVMADAAADLRERITALGRAHDFVRPHSVQSRRDAAPDSLHGLLAELFAPYGRVRVKGDDLPIDDRSATPVALLFHELATNATKYGALSADGGEVTVTVARDDGRATISWTERGGPPVTKPQGETGFGTQLVELSVVRQLGGDIRRDWRPDGLVVTLGIPLSAFGRR